MKKLLIITACTALTGTLCAQSVQDAEKDFYYNRYQSAGTAAHAVLQKEPGNAAAWYWLTQAYLQQNKADKLRDSLLAAPAAVKGEPLYEVAYGHLLLQKAQKDSAQHYFAQALQQTKEKNADVLAAVARAQVETKEGNADYAVTLLDKAIKRDKKNAGLYTLLGDAYRKAQKGSEAYQAYTNALDKDKSNAAALYRLGKIFVSQKNPEMYLKYFNEAIAADAAFAPAYFELYNHYYYTDAAQAMDYFKQYLARTDADPRNDYYFTDLLYLTKQYTAAIDNAGKLIKQDEHAQARLYKLIAYSYGALKDTASAISYMQQYFAKAPDSNFIAQDYETMGQLYATVSGGQDSVALFYQKAAALEQDSVKQYAYYKKLAALFNDQKNYSAQATWLGKYYQGNDKANNVDLFNWGLAHYRAQEYAQADSVFGLYTTKYPEQGFGFYWRARSSSLLDPQMEQGLAVPYYTRLAEIIGADKDNETNKKWLVEAYGYLAAYETNHDKDYQTAVNYFEKVLEVDPGNEDAKKYIAILEKNMASAEAKGSK